MQIQPRKGLGPVQCPAGVFGLLSARERRALSGPYRVSMVLHEGCTLVRAGYTCNPPVSLGQMATTPKFTHGTASSRFSCN